MIGDILEVIAKESAKYIEDELNIPKGKKGVLLYSPQSRDGSNSMPDNCILLSLLGIEEEMAMKNNLIIKKVINGKVYKQNPAINIYLQVIFISNFRNDYINELNAIAKIIEFFQKNPTLNSKNSEYINELGIKSISFNINTIPLKEQNNILSLIGGEYRPSIIYKVGPITIQDELKPIDEQIVKNVRIKSQQR